MRYLLTVIAALASAVAPLAAHSQAPYPTKSIRFIVPSGPAICAIKSVAS